jgi:CcmD family protein
MSMECRQTTGARSRQIVNAVLGLMLTTWWLAVPLLALQPPAGQDEFVPIDQLPASEQLPGGVFVIVAYGFIWVGVMLYLWSVRRRLSKVEDDMRALQRRSGSRAG